MRPFSETAHGAGQALAAAAGSLGLLFAPRSVAVIGAGRDPDSISGRLFRNLQAGFQGSLYPVNANADVVQSVRAYRTVLDVPGPVDVAFVAVRAAAVADVVRDCLRKQVRGLVVISAGFGELGAAGREHELVAAVRAAGARMIGPNCLGIQNTDPHVLLNGTFATSMPPRGNVAICTQSGALGVIIPDVAGQRNLGISSFASIGNKADVGENDLLGYWARDARTTVIAMYLESFQDAHSFLQVVREVSQRKPIVVLKAGASQSAARAASSHTAALACTHNAAEALLRQAGAIQVATVDELLNASLLLATQPLPAGRRVAVLTNAGGLGVLCADALEAEGLLVPAFSLALQARLRSTVSATAAVGNPIDLVASVNAAEFQHALQALLASDEVDAVIVIFVPRTEGSTPLVASAIHAVALARDASKPVLAVFTPHDRAPEPLADVRLQIPWFRWPEAAAKALAKATWRAERLRRDANHQPRTIELDRAAVDRVITRLVATSETRGGWLHPTDTQALLTAFGFKTPGWGVARTADEAVVTASGLGGAVALKLISPTVTHKSDVGGVALDVRGADAVREAFCRVTARSTDAQGVFVQEYVPGGVEVIVGAMREVNLGHRILCGLGGSLVELHSDVVFGMAPLTSRDADEMLDSWRGVQRLTGFRGGPPCDVQALADALLRVSALVEALPEIAEMDLNPIRVFGRAEGLLVVDARVRLG